MILTAFGHCRAPSAAAEGEWHVGSGNAYGRRARARQARVVFPEVGEARVAEAMARLERDGVWPARARCAEPDRRSRCRGAGRGARHEPGAGAADAGASRCTGPRRWSPAGEAEAMVAGADAPTRRVIEAAAIGIGLADGVDDAVLVLPDAVSGRARDDLRRLRGERRARCRRARRHRPRLGGVGRALLGEARVALLSFSTGSSGAGASVDRCAPRPRPPALPGRCRPMRR